MEYFKGILSLDVPHIIVTSKIIDWSTARNEGQAQCCKAFTTAIFVTFFFLL